MDTKVTEVSVVKDKILYVDPLEACRLMDSTMRGLSEEEAQRRLAQYGKNELEQKKQDSLLKKLLQRRRHVSMITLTIKTLGQLKGRHLLQRLKRIIRCRLRAGRLVSHRHRAAVMHGPALERLKQTVLE